MVDRRSQVHWEVELPARVLVCASKETFRGRITNISHGGAKLWLDHALGRGAEVALQLTHPDSDICLSTPAQVVWMSFDEKTSKHEHGLAFQDVAAAQSQLDRFVSLTGKASISNDRRSGLPNADFPILRRGLDYARVAGSDPHHSFLQSLKRVAKETDLSTIIVAPGLEFLTKRIREALPEPRLIPLAKARQGEINQCLVVLSIDTRRHHTPTSNLDFEEYQVREPSRGEPSRSLSTVSRITSEGTDVHFLNYSPIKEPTLAKKFFGVSKFENARFHDFHWCTATKRALLSQELSGGDYSLREVEDPEGIEAIQSFATGIFNGERNFDKGIDGLFNAHSDFYGIYSNATGELVNFARITLHLPGHSLPCMLATQRGSDRHLILQAPDTVSYGEVFSPYIKSLSAARVYSHLVKVIVSYGETGKVNVMFTTYDAQDERSLRFFTKYLGFQDTGAVLNYGTFGGDWGLIFCSQDSFAKNVKVQFSQGASRLVREAV